MARGAHATGARTTLHEREADAKKRMGERASAALQSFLGSASHTRTPFLGAATSDARDTAHLYRRAFVPGLPKGWQAAVDLEKGGAVYYFNDSTGQSTWLKPQA